MSAHPEHPGPGVLIVGAGPTGLTLAIALASQGVPFQIVDRKSAPSRDSKALALNIAAQYSFELMGLGGRLGGSGCRLDRVNVFWEGRRLSAIDMRRLDFHQRAILTQPQADTERELIGMLASLGHAVRWQTQVLEVSQDAQGIRAVLEASDGTRTNCEHAYAVGCDGKGSLLRQAITPNFTGADYPVHFVVGDYRLNWGRPRNQGYYHVYEDTFFIILPVGDDAWRVVVRRDGEPPANREVASEEITAIVTAKLGSDPFEGPPTWLSRAPFYMRVADRLRHGRFFIAGDAAHLFSPIGGTGMNTGMQDALNLGWKLAFRLRGLAHDGLLDTYEAERLEAIRMTAAVTDRSTRLITRIDRDPSLVANMMPSMRNRPSFRHVLPVVHSGLGASSTQAMAVKGGSPAPGSRRAGEFCLGLHGLLEDAASHGGPSGDVRLTVVARIHTADDHDLSDWRGLAGLVRDAGTVARIVVLTSDAGLARRLGSRAGDAVQVLWANEGMCRKLGVGPDAVIAAYPNGVIGYSGAWRDAQDTQSLRGFLSAYFVGVPGTSRPPAAFQPSTALAASPVA